MPAVTRTFRVFVSSTFSDFTAERNALREHVFPRLGELCLANGAHFQAVDLRWGVSEEASQDQQTMGTCLEEIRRCQGMTPRPNFIALVGDRYGWRPLPAEIPAGEYARIARHIANRDDLDLLTQWYRRDDNAVPPVHCLQPRHGDYADYERWSTVERHLTGVLRGAAEGLDLPPERRLTYVASATEQEVTLGALGARLAGSALCVLRAIDGLPADRTAEHFRDLDDDGSPDVKAEALLDDLKTRLRRYLPRSVLEYHARWTGGVPTTDHIEQLCTEVATYLTRTIEQELQQVEQPDPLEREIGAHERFGRERCKGFVGRADALRAIHDYLGTPARQPLAVVGPSGAGKSALLARAFEQVMQQPSGVRIVRFLGVTAQSSTPRTLLESLCRQVARAYGEEEGNLPAELWELASELAGRLKLARAGRELVVFLDALDQLDGAPDWLPVALPPYVHLVVSTLSGGPAERLRDRLGLEQLVELRPMPRGEGEVLLDAWLAEAGRNLQPRQRADLVAKFATGGSPLYLRVAFQEASRWHSYEGLPAGADPEPGLSADVPGVMRDLFARLSAEAQHGPVLVARSLGYLAASRNGLSDDELVEVLSADRDVLDDFCRRSPKSPPVQSLPTIVWSRLYFDLEPYLAEHGADGASTIGFYHRQLAEVATRDYLAGTHGRARHRQLAAFFGAQPLRHQRGGRREPNLRKLSEWPFQLARGQLWPEFDRSLMDFDFLQEKVAAAGPAALVEDFDLASAPALATALKDAVGETRHLWSVRDAVRSSAHVTGEDPHQFAGQLLGRLGKDRSARVQELLAEAAAWGGAGWLRPLTPSLLAPGAMRRTLIAGRLSAETVALTPDGRQILSPSDDNTIAIWDLRSGRRVRVLRGHTDLVRAVAVSADGRRVVSASEDKTLRAWDPATGSAVQTIASPTISALAVAVTPDGQRAVAAAQEYPLAVWDLRTGKAGPVLRGHTNLVRAIAFAPDGERAISTAWDETLRVWDVQTGEVLKVLDGYGLTGETAALAPDGRHAVVPVEGGVIAVLDLRSGEVVVTLHGHEDLIRAVAVTPDGGLLVSASQDKTVRVWNLRSGTMLKTLRGHTDEVGALALTPDGQRIVSADRRLKVWDVGSGTLLGTLGSHANAVESIDVAADGRLAVSTDGNELKCWDLDSAAELTGLGRRTRSPHRMAITPDGQLVVVAEQALRTWALASGTPLLAIRRRAMSGSAVAVSRDSNLAVTTLENHPLLIWNVGSGRPAGALQGHVRYVRDIAITADGNRAVSASWDGTVRVWDLQSKRSTRTLRGHGISGQAVAVTGDGRLALTPSNDDTIKVWDVPSRRVVGSLVGHTESVEAVAVTPDGRRAVSGSRDRTVRVWDVPTGKLLRTLTGHSNAVDALTMTPDGRLAVSAAIDRTVRIWEVHSKAGSRRPAAHADFVRRVTVTPDGRLCISAADDATLQVWDMRSGRRIRTLSGHAAEVWDVAVVPDGRALSGSRDRTLKLWALRRGKLLSTLTGHEETVTSVAVSADGRHAVSGSYDDNAIAWELASGRLLHTFRGHSSLVNTVAITPDGALAVSGSLDSTVRAWDMRSGAALAVWEGHADSVDALSITPIGSLVVSGGMNDGNLRLWSLQTMKPVAPIAAGFNSVHCLAISPDGRLAVCGLDDTRENFIGVFDLVTRGMVRRFGGHTDLIRQVTVSADGRLAISVSSDHTLRAWDLRDGDPIACFTADGGLTAVAMSPDAETIAAGTESGEMHFLRPEGIGS